MTTDTIDLYSIFVNKFDSDHHNVDFDLTNEDDLYSYAHAKFMQYAYEIEKEYGINSEDLDDGVEWYDEDRDDIVLEFCSKLNKNEL